MSGAVHIAFEDLKKSQKDVRITALESQLESVRSLKDTKISGLQDQLKKEKKRAERESMELNSEITSLKEQLAQKDVRSQTYCSGG